MNETIQPGRASDVPWPTSDQRAQVPDTSMWPGSEKAPRDAHDTIDRLADGAASAVQRLGQSVAAAEDTLQAKTRQLRDTRNAWVDGVRTTVRGRPLVSVAAAVALGALIARISR